MIVEIIRIDGDQRRCEQIKSPTARITPGESDAIMDAGGVDPFERGDQTTVPEIELLPPDSEPSALERLVPECLMNIELIGKDCAFPFVVDRREAGDSRDARIASICEAIGMPDEQLTAFKQTLVDANHVYVFWQSKAGSSATAFDHDGKKVFETTVPEPSGSPSSGETWLAHWVGDRGLAVSGTRPLVAVGGSGAVSVWDVKRGEKVFSEP